MSLGVLICCSSVVHLFGQQASKDHVDMNSFLTEIVNNILVSIFLNTVIV